MREKVATSKTNEEVRADAEKLYRDSGKLVLVQGDVVLKKATENTFILEGDNMPAAYFRKESFNGNPPKKGQRFGLVVFQLNGK